MTYSTYSELAQAMATLARSGSPQDALDLLTTHAPHFDEKYERMTLYYQMNLLSMMARKREAIRKLEEALNQGYWYAASWLREDDDDLQAIFHEPDFQRLRTLSIERHQAANRRSAPSLRVVPPRDESIADPPLLIALHGNNSNAGDARAEWLSAARLGWFLAVPQSSQIVAEDRYIWDDFDKATDELQTHLRALEADDRWQSAPVVVGGFSMGGGLAAFAALTGVLPAAGFILVAPYIPDVEALAAAITARAAQGQTVRGYILIGAEDAPCLPNAKALAAIMDDAELPVKLDIRPGLSHVYPDDFEDVLAHALDFVSTSVPASPES